MSASRKPHVRTASSNRDELAGVGTPLSTLDQNSNGSLKSAKCRQQSTPGSRLLMLKRVGAQNLKSVGLLLVRDHHGKVAGLYVRRITFLLLLHIEQVPVSWTKSPVVASAPVICAGCAVLLTRPTPAAMQEL